MTHNPNHPQAVSEKKRKLVSELTDEELFDEIREQVNLSRNAPASYERERTRELGNEARKRGWKL